MDETWKTRIELTLLEVASNRAPVRAVKTVPGALFAMVGVGTNDWVRICVGEWHWNVERVELFPDDLLVVLHTLPRYYDVSTGGLDELIAIGDVLNGKGWAVCGR